MEPTNATHVVALIIRGGPVHRRSFVISVAALTMISVITLVLGVDVGTLFLLIERTMIVSYFLLATPARAFDVLTQALN